MLSQQSLMDQLNRKIALLDQYASTLEKQNLAKNNETQTLYNQLNEIRNENDILRSHLSRINQQNIERMRKEQSPKEIQRQNQSVNSSVELDRSRDKQQPNLHQNKPQRSSISCQTQFQQSQTDPNIIHYACTQQITKLLKTITQKDHKIQQITTESQQMYDSIIHLEEDNDQVRKIYIDLENKFKTQSKQLKSYQIQIQQMTTILNEQREIIEQEKINLQTQRDNSNAAQHEIERLIRQNNRLIEKIRMLEKEKNSFYAELRGKNVSPLKTSQISSRQNIQNIQNGTKPSFTGIPYTSSDQKPQPQRFSSQFGIGKQKQKVKADRWRKIEEKINRVKQENQQLRANLTIN